MVKNDRKQGINKKTIFRLIAIFTILLFSYKILFKPSPILIRGLSLFICPQAKYFFKTEKKSIALTIDDIPDNNRLFPHTTLEILDVLNRYEAKATFFVITNQAKDFPLLMKSIVEQGHELGNHLTNDEPSIELQERFETEFVKADKFLSQFATVRWFRPGHGFCNVKMSEIVQKYSYKIALGSVWSYDTNSLVSPRFSSWYIKQNIRPGAIIILHDSQAKSDRRGQNTIKTLNHIIPQLQQQGYRFVTLSELDREAQQR
ncbi:MAG: polysaccharide deacetylase family protein [Cyanobacteria bacterium P01_G01_bin.19]